VAASLRAGNAGAKHVSEQVRRGGEKVKKDDKAVLHVGAHLVSQGIAAAMTKDGDDSDKAVGAAVALIVGLVLNLIISGL
jgi:hypothetical protein